MPLPPPPADALTRSGKPTASAASLSLPSWSPSSSVRPGTTGTSASCIRRACLDLRAHRADRRGRRADPDQPGVHDRSSEVGVLGEEAVARVDGVGARALRGLDDRRRRAGRTPRAWRPPARPRVGLAHERRVRVGLRVHRDRRDAELAAGAEDAPGDLAAVGDEQAVDDALVAHIRKTPKPLGAPHLRRCGTTLSAMPSTVRVSRGSMIAVVVAARRVAQRRRLAPRSAPRPPRACSAACSSSISLAARRRRAARATMSTARRPAAAGPITADCAFGQENRNRGSVRRGRTSRSSPRRRSRRRSARGAAPSSSTTALIIFAPSLMIPPCS